MSTVLKNAPQYLFGRSSAPRTPVRRAADLRNDTDVGGQALRAIFRLTSANNALHALHPEVVLGPGAVTERMGLFAFSKVLGKGRPPPDVETISPGALGIRRSLATMER